MTQTESVEPEERPLHPAEEEAVLRRLLRGTVFHPDEPDDDGLPEERRSRPVHCRTAMGYLD